MVPCSLKSAERNERRLRERDFCCKICIVNKRQSELIKGLSILCSDLCVTPVQHSIYNPMTQLAAFYYTGPCKKKKAVAMRALFSDLPSPPGILSSPPRQGKGRDPAWSDAAKKVGGCNRTFWATGGLFS